MKHRKIKKLIVVLLAVAMLLPVFPVSAVYASVPIDWKVLGDAVLSSQETEFTSLTVYDGITYAAFSTYWGGNKTGVYSYDENRGWNLVGSYLDEARYGTLCLDNETLYFAYVTPDQDVKLVKYDLNDSEGHWVELGTLMDVDDKVSLYVHNGTPYVAFSGAERPIVMEYEEAGGRFQMVGNNFLWGSHNSLSLKGDRDGNLYLSYVYQGDAMVQKLSRSDDGWGSWEQVGSTAVSGGAEAADASLFVYDDTPYVAFTDISEDRKCVVKKLVDNSWVTVGSGESVSDDVAAGNSLYIDEEGTPYVAYEAGNSHNAVVYKLEDGSWVPVGTGGYASSGPASHLSLAVSDGIAYLAYGDGHRGGAEAVMKYEPPAPQPSSEWETVGNAPLSSSYSNFTSLFINEGIPYIAFSDYWGNGDRIVAERFVSNQWEVVGLNRYSGEFVMDGSVYVDEDGDTPYIAYITNDADVKVLKLIDYGDVIDWQTVGSTTSLSDSASDLSLYAHNGVSYVAYADMDHGYRPAVKMFTEGSTVPTAVGTNLEEDYGETAANFLSMKGDAAGNLYLVFEAWIDSESTSGIIVLEKPHSSNTWSMVGDLVSSEAGYFPSLYLYDDGSGDVTPYVAYTDQSGLHPIVKKLVDNEWVTVGDDYVSEDTSSEISLYVDEDGTPYVAYVIGEGSYTRVFKLDNNSWVPVGGDGYASDGDSSGISLSVSKGVPYLSYIDYDNDGRAVVRRYVPTEAPTISAQSGDQAVIAGQTATFTVTAAGAAPLTYQWFKDGEEIDGADSNILRITDAQESDEGVYTCNISNAGGDVTTDGATLTVNAPGALVLNATPGNQHVSLTWNDVPGATIYQVYQDTTLIENILDHEYDVTGLTNGTTYQFEVRALDENNVVIASSGLVSATPYTSSGGHGSSSSTTKPSSTGADILVNGKTESAGTLSTTTQGGRTVSTVAVDPEKLKQKLDAEGNHAVVTIPVNSKSDIVVGELNGEMVKNMENKQAVIEVKTGTSAYTLPAQQINIKAISEQFGQNVGLGDIKVQIEIANSAASTVKVVENSAQQGGFSLVVQPMEFTVKCTYGSKTVEVSQFNAYVERTVAIPDGVDPSKITTGVVVDPDGTVRHMPTRITVIDGKYYAVINSLTNSTYSVVWHPLEFTDVANHWAKEAVNNMGSRMVISGTGNGMFEPNRDITRAEFAAIVVRGLGLKPGTGKNPFSDVKPSDWYSESIETATTYGLITGYGNGSFAPMEKITREQAMAIVGRAMEITGLKEDLVSGEANTILAAFGDSDKVSSWARETTAASVKEGIVTGKNGNLLAPEANITRAEVAAIIERLLKESDLIN